MSAQTVSVGSTTSMLMLVRCPRKVSQTLFNHRTGFGDLPLGYPREYVSLRPPLARPLQGVPHQPVARYPVSVRLRAR